MMAITGELWVGTRLCTSTQFPSTVWECCGGCAQRNPNCPLSYALQSHRRYPTARSLDGYTLVSKSILLLLLLLVLLLLLLLLLHYTAVPLTRICVLYGCTASNWAQHTLTNFVMLLSYVTPPPYAMHCGPPMQPNAFLKLNVSEFKCLGRIGQDGARQDWKLDRCIRLAAIVFIIIIIKRRSGINPIPPTVIDRD